MDLAAQLSVSNIPKQRAVTIITHMSRIVTLRTIAVPVRITVNSRRPIRSLTIAQTVRFVRRFPLRESWQL